MMTERQLKAMLAEISGKRAQAHIAQLVLHDRVPGTTGFRNALEYVRKEFRRCGLRDVRIERFPARRGLRYWTWPSGDVWEPISAELRIVAPEKEQTWLAGYPDEAISLAAASGPTPAAGITRRLVFVGRGDTPACYTRKSMRGNIALIEGSGALPCYLATSKHGAVGVVRCSTPANSLDFPDLAGRDRVVADPGLRPQPFGFSLPRRRFEMLKALVLNEQEEGRPVRLFARVAARRRAGTMDVLSATIRGTDRGERAGEFIFVAHLCHPRPSANDNASGVALCLETARVLHNLIRKRELPSPRLTIRFLVCAEWAGTIPWVVRHSDWMGHVLGALSLDMVGEDQAKCGSVLNVHAAHSSNAHFLSDLVCRTLADVRTAGGSRLAGFRFAHAPYVGASDNAPFAAKRVAVPNVALIQWPDHYYHSTEDTLDKTSPVSLEATGAAALAAFYAVSNPALPSVGTLIREVGARVRDRLLRAIEKATTEVSTHVGSPMSQRGLRRLMLKAREAIWSALQVCEHHKRVGLDALRSLSGLLTRLHAADERLAAHILLDRELAGLEAIAPGPDLDAAARLSLISQGWAVGRAFPSSTRRDIISQLAHASPDAAAHPPSPLQFATRMRPRLSPLPPALDRLAGRAASLLPAWSPKYAPGGPFNWYCMRDQLSGTRLLDLLKLTKKTAKSMWLGDEPVYWLDGTRTVLDIWRILQAEGVPLLDHTGVPARTPPPSDLKYFLDYFHLLEKCGYVRLLSSATASSLSE